MTNNGGKYELEFNECLLCDEYPTRVFFQPS